MTPDSPRMSARDPRISIVVTSYNHRAYLVAAIESVLAQTLMPHEIIVADDASSDGSQETIRAYERRFPGLVRGVFQEKQRRHSQEPATPGSAPSRRLRRHPGRRRLVSPAQARGAGGRSPGLTRRDARLRQLPRRRRPAPSASREVERTATFGRVFWDVARGKRGLLRTLIVDYAAVKDAGLMDERFARHDGLWLTIKLAARCKIAYVDDVLLDKREHSTSDLKTIRPEERLRI